MINTATLFVFCVFFVLVKVYRSKKKPHKISFNHGIPGPQSYPILTNFWSVSKLDPVPYRAWNSLTQQFGPIVRLVLGPTFMCILGGMDEIKEAMNNEHLDDRGNSPTADMMRFGSTTFEEISFFGRGLQPEGTKINSIQRWRELRRFTLKSLRDLGFGKSASEEAIIEECKVLTDKIKRDVESSDGIIDIEKNLTCASLNVIWNLAAGQRFLYDDLKMRKLVSITSDFMGLAKHVLGKPFGFLPFLRFIPPYRSIFQKLSNSFIDFNEFMEKAIIEHEETLDKNNPRDYIDMFLIQMEQDQDGIYSRKQLVSTCIDLFIAGSETTSKSNQYAIAVLMRHPDVQTKLQAELDEIEPEVITLKDKNQLPYTEATLSEMWRFCNIAPFGPPRYAHQDTKIRDKTIPKDAVVMYNTYTLHMDANHWGDPHIFRPERFLDSNGKYCNNEMLNPFGIGRRKCLGESLARMENFLFFANIFRTFKFSQVGDELPSLEPDVAFTNGPYPFKTKITVRS